MYGCSVCQKLPFPTRNMTRRWSRICSFCCCMEMQKPNIAMPYIPRHISKSSFSLTHKMAHPHFVHNYVEARFGGKMGHRTFDFESETLKQASTIFCIDSFSINVYICSLFSKLRKIIFALFKKIAVHNRL